MTTREKLDILFTAAGIPKPFKVNETKKHLTLVWNGDQSMNSAVIVDILQKNDINHPDPRGNTNDTLFIVERATDNTVRTVMTMDRLNKKGYEAVLASAIDTDGDGVAEMEPATDEVEEIAATEREVEADKHIDD